MPTRKRDTFLAVSLTALAGLLLGGALLLPTFSVNVIHETESPYQSIFVTEADGVRHMHAGSLRDRTSAIDLDEPRRHVYEYTAMMMLALGYVENPRDILVVGLGGGTMTRALRRLHPQARIVNLEFDPVVVTTAREYFGFEADAGMEVVVQDGRRWLRSSGEQFDLILLDAYHGGYIPFHLTTKEFLELVRERLAPGGVVCANTWTNQKLAERESATYAAVFGEFHQYLGRQSKNRIIVAAPGPMPGPEAVRSRLAALQARYEPAHLDLPALFDRHFDAVPARPDRARVLTDDHAPVNLLKEDS
jgi:spermidine synthase